MEHGNRGRRSKNIRNSQNLAIFDQTFCGNELSESFFLYDCLVLYFFFSTRSSTSRTFLKCHRGIYSSELQVQEGIYVGQDRGAKISKLP